MKWLEAVQGGVCALLVLAAVGFGLRAVPSEFVSDVQQDLSSVRATGGFDVDLARKLTEAGSITDRVFGFSTSLQKASRMEISVSNSVTSGIQSNAESLFTTLPAIMPKSGTVGTVYTVSEGVAPGATLTIALTLDGVDVSSELVPAGANFTYTSDQPGTLQWEVTAQATGSDPQIYATGAQVNPAEATVIEMNGVTFSTSQAFQTGYDAAGKAYIVIPTGSETLTIERGATQEGGFAISGAQINPTRLGTAQQMQGYDARIADTYDPALNIGSSVDVTSGDIVMVAKSASPKLGDDGYIDDWASLHVLDQPLPAGAILTASTGWSGRSDPSHYAIDVAALLSGIPTYSSAGLNITPFDRLMSSLSKFAGAYAQNTATNSQWGYENFAPNGLSGTPGSGYGRDIASMINMASIALMSDAYTAPQREAVALKLIQHGLEWGDPIRGSGVSLTVDGGHHQFHLAPAALALEATGRRSEISTILGDLGGNFRQAFQVTSQLIASEFAPHDDLEKPGFARRRTLPAQPGGIALTIPTTYGGTGGIHGDWQQVALHEGMRVIRESDGAEATLIETSSFPMTANEDLSLAINQQPSPAFTAGDIVYLAPPAGWIEDGQFDWALRGGFSPDGADGRRSYFSPSATVAYRDLQRWGGQIMLIKSLGLLPNQLEAAEGYMLRAAASNTPAAINDYPPVFGTFTDVQGSVYDSEANFFTTHWPTIEALPQVLDVDLPAVGSITTIGVSAPGTLIDGLVVGLPSGGTDKDVDIRGTGETGYTVEARVLRQSDDTVVVDWTSLGAVSAGGFGGTLNVPKSDGWLKLDLRYVGQTEIAQDTRRWAVGYKVLLLGQSQMSIFTNADATPAVYSMTPANHDTASFWQNQEPGGETISLLGASDDRDGLSSFVDQFRQFDQNTPIFLVREAIEGTSVLDLVDDSRTARNWSDLQSKIDRYGGDYTAVISHWDTSNRGGAALGDQAGQYFDIITGANAHGYTVDHSLADILDPTYRFIINPATRHGYSIGDWRENAVLEANARNYTVGPPIIDYPLKDSAHPEGSEQGNAVMGERLATALARDLGLDTSVNPALAGTATRAAGGTHVDVDIDLRNGGSLFSPTPNNLQGWQVSTDGGNNWSYTGFTAGIVGNTVRLTPTSGTWPPGVQVAKVGDPYGFTDIATEISIANGELYESWSESGLGLGLPVHGLIIGGEWTMPTRAAVLATDEVTGPGSWTPANLASLAAWHEITDGSEVTVSAGTDVATWLDKSVNNRTLTLNSAVGSVVYETQGAAGAAALNFTQGGMSYASTIPDVRAVYFVARDMSFGSSGSAFVTPVVGEDHISGSVVNHVFVRGGDKADYTVSVDGSGSTGSTGNAAMNGRPMEPSGQTGTNIALSYATINAEAKRNAEALWAINLGQNIPVDLVGMMESSSAAFLGNGTISALVLLTEVPSLEDHQRVEGYLAHLTETEDLLPIDHPYRSAAP